MARSATASATRATQSLVKSGKPAAAIVPNAVLEQWRRMCEELFAVIDEGHVQNAALAMSEEALMDFIDACPKCALKPKTNARYRRAHVCRCRHKRVDQRLYLWRTGEIEILVSSESLAELQRVLTYPRVQRYLQYIPAQIERALGATFSFMPLCPA